MSRFMRKFRKQFRYGEKGFTLIELLIVVGILGILVAVAIPNIGRFMTAGTIGAANAEARMVMTAVDSCLAEAGVMELTTGQAAWTGVTGEVTAVSGGITYDANNYLTLKGGTLVGTYDIDADGDPDPPGFVQGIDYGSLTWVDASYEWVE